jgi:hypothetical protein
VLGCLRCVGSVRWRDGGGNGRRVPFWEFCEVEEGGDVENVYYMVGLKGRRVKLERVECLVGEGNI